MSKTPTYDDLTGFWENSSDKGTYYFRQITPGVGSAFAWFGQGSPKSLPPNFANVAMGVRKANQLKIHWCDVPNKGNTDNPGNMPPGAEILLAIIQNKKPPFLEIVSVPPSGSGNFKLGKFTPK